MKTSSCWHLENTDSGRSNYEFDQEWLESPNLIREGLDSVRKIGSIRPDETDLPTPGNDEHDYHYKAPPHLDHRLPLPPHPRFEVLQRWEGTVLEVGQSDFSARLRDLTNIGIDEETSLFKEDLSQDDRRLLRPGAIFYLNIGYQTSVTGQRIRGLTIRFKRLPKWSADEILDAWKRGQERLSRLVRG